MKRLGRAFATVTVCVVVAAAALVFFPVASAADGLSYQEVLTGGAIDVEPLPIVIALHGLGDKPESFRLVLDDLGVRARLVVPRAPLPHGEDGFSWFDFRAENDEQLALGIRSAAQAVAELITTLLASHAGPKRVIVTGFSQGGMLSFALAAARPDLVEAAIPVSGYLPPPMWPAERPQFRPLPRILALHGDADHVVPIDSARWTIEALRSNGYQAELRGYAGVGHSMTKEMRAALHEAIKAAIVELAPPAGATAAQPTPAPR